MTRAIFFDVDGTLVSFRTHVISPAVLEALHALRARGIRLFVASGRHKGMLSYVRSAFPFDGYVTLSGQYCFAGERVLYRNPMEPEAAAELVAAVESEGFSCIFLEGEEIYINRVDDKSRQFFRELSVDMPPVRPPRYALGRELYQGVTFLDKAHEGLLLGRAPHVKATRWHPNFLDVIPAAGGKDRGMDAVLDYFGIPLEESMAFGDGENDLSMLRHAGIGVAMGSADGEVKAGADYVTGTVDEDGIVGALRRFQLL